MSEVVVVGATTFAAGGGGAAVVVGATTFAAGGGEEAVVATRVVLGRLLLLQAAPTPTPRQMQMHTGIPMKRRQRMMEAATTPPTMAPTLTAAIPGVRIMKQWYVNVAVTLPTPNWSPLGITTVYLKRVLQ